MNINTYNLILIDFKETSRSEFDVFKGQSTYNIYVYIYIKS